jgi:Toastrack DUF4097
VIERTFTTPGPLRLELVVPSGSIEVETVEGAETHVTLDADSEEALESARVELRELGGGHEVVVGVGRRLGPLGGVFVYGGRSLPDYRLRVTCPADARLVVKTAAADIAARGTFADATVRTVSGDAAVERVGGSVDASSVSGDLTIVADADLTAKSVSGDVQLEVASGAVRVTSVSGDVDVAIRRGSRLYVDANSVSGALDSELTLSAAPDEAGEGPLVDLKAKTVSGDVRVRRAGPRESQTA